MAFAQENGKIQLSLKSPTDPGEDIGILQVAAWDTLADFVLEHHGTQLTIPKDKAEIKEVEPPPKQEVKEVKPPKPVIEIFKSGMKSKHR